MTVVLRPLRFTDRVEEMRAFLEALGMRSRIESERGGWVDLVAGQGMVALHDAASSEIGAAAGQTHLSFEAEDLDGLAERLDGAGFGDVTVWDEAYGRVLAADVAGVRIWVDERSDDRYGYREHSGARPDEQLAVTPILYVAEPEPWQRFLGCLGGDSSGLVSFRPGAAGIYVRLGFRTAATDLGSRLAAYEVSRSGDLELLVTDPDGQPVVVTREGG